MTQGATHNMYVIGSRDCLRAKPYQIVPAESRSMQKAQKPMRFFGSFQKAPTFFCFKVEI